LKRGAPDALTRHHDRVNEQTPAPTASTDPLAEEAPPSDPVLDAIQPHPGRTVPWPPTKDQRGLAAPYPPGGRDPEPDAGLTEERRYLRLLIAMVVLIIGGGFAIGIIGALLGFSGGPG
jgi:hypothetical protein